MVLTTGIFIILTLLLVVDFALFFPMVNRLTKKLGELNDIHARLKVVDEALANEIVKKVESVRGVVSTEISIKESAPELKIHLDRQRIADLGLSTSQIAICICKK